MDIQSGVEIVIGRALAGKTQRLLREYRQELSRAVADGRPGTTLWLSTTSRACRQVLNQLLDDSLPASFAPNVLTFESFAERVLQQTGTGWIPVSPARKRMLARRIIDELRDEGRLLYFASIAQTSGFLDLVLSLISELKREEIWPDQFEQACRARGANPKDKELALIYQEYQELLRRHACYDAEGRFWSARDVLKTGHWGPFQNLSLVVVDGFTDFTHTQYEILGYLAAASKRLLIALPMEQPLVRSDLYAKSVEALERIRNSIRGSVRLSVQRADKPQPPHPASLEHVARNLFADPDVVEPYTDATGVEILAVTGQEREVEVVAERVKRLLLQGVGAGEIVVTFRPLDEYADLVEEVFTAAGIPFHCAAARPLSREPILKTLIRVFQLEHDDWRFDRLMSVLDSSYFRPCWAGMDKSKAVRAAASELRRLKLHRGRAQMLRVLSRELDSGVTHNESPRVETTPQDDIPSPIKSALSLLEKLSQVTERLRQEADFGAWAQITVSLARELGIAFAPSAKEFTDPQADHDRKIWEVFENLLFDAQNVEQLFTEPPRRMDMWKFLTLLEDLLRAEGLPDQRGEQGKVRVLDADQVRNLDVPYLFLAGMTETSFPGRRDDDCLYGERERLELNQHGLCLGNRASHSQEEMLLFYGIVTRARRKLVLSYPAVSSNGQPLFPSPYLDAVESLFDAKALPVQVAGDLKPVPTIESVLTPAHLRIVATQAVREKRPGLFRAMMEHSSSEATAQNILASVRLNIQRFHTRGFTPCEGMLSMPASRDHLRRLFPADYQFSATQLEAYAYCPFRFLLSEILKLETADPPEAATDYRERGTVVHDVLATIHEREPDIVDDSALPTEEELVSRFEERVRSLLKRRPAYTGLEQALIRIEERLLLEWAEAYGRQWTEYVSRISNAWDKGPIPARLEVAFGDVPGVEVESSEPEFAYLTFGKGDRKARVRGRIDRVDVGKNGSQTVYNVIDYKTGRPKTFDNNDVAAGRAMQLALYMIAVQRLKIAGPGAVPFQMGYWCLKESGFTLGLKRARLDKLSACSTEVLTDLEQSLDEVIPELAHGIRTGSFPVYSQDDDCTSNCPYNMVCRVNQIVPLVEKLDKRPKGSRE